MQQQQAPSLRCRSPTRRVTYARLYRRYAMMAAMQQQGGQAALQQYYPSQFYMQGAPTSAVRSLPLCTHTHTVGQAPRSTRRQSADLYSKEHFSNKPADADRV